MSYRDCAIAKQRRMRLPNLGVDFPATDLAAVARAYGGHGVRVTD